MWKFDLSQKWKMMLQFLSTLSLQILDHFNDETVLQQIWTTKINNLDNKFFLMPVTICKGQQRYLSIMQCNDNDNEDC